MQKFVCKVCRHPNITSGLLQVHILRHIIEDHEAKLIYNPECPNVFLWDVAIFDAYDNLIFHAAKHRDNKRDVFFVWNTNTGGWYDDVFTYFHRFASCIWLALTA